MTEHIRNNDNTNNKFQILSLSGGGFLGLYTVSILEKFEERLRGPVAQHFDLICGTSIGGIIALGLACGASAKDIRISFENHGPDIFKNQAPDKKPFWLNFLGDSGDIVKSAWEHIPLLKKAKHPAHELRQAIEEIVTKDRVLGEAIHRVLVPAVNLTRGSPTVFKTPHCPQFSVDCELKVSDIAMATSAAPTIFPLAEIGDSLYADGGLFANSPDALGYHEATQFLGISEESIHCLSIGTTMQKFSFGHKTGIDLGLVDWATNQRLLQAMLSSQQQSVDFMMQHRLGDRYQRIDRFPSPEQSNEIGLDKASPNAIRNLKGLGAEDFKTAVGNPKIMEFFEHTAPAPTFYHGPNAKKDK